MASPLVETFGPFLIPAVIFVIGLDVYAVLVVLSRRGLLPSRNDRGP